MLKIYFEFLEALWKSGTWTRWNCLEVCRFNNQGCISDSFMIPSIMHPLMTYFMLMRENMRIFLVAYCFCHLIFECNKHFTIVKLHFGLSLVELFSLDRITIVCSASETRNFTFADGNLKFHKHLWSSNMQGLIMPFSQKICWYFKINFPANSNNGCNNKHDLFNL